MSGSSKLRNISQLRQSYVSLSSVLASVVLLQRDIMTMILLYKREHLMGGLLVVSESILIIAGSMATHR